MLRKLASAVLGISLVATVTVTAAVPPAVVSAATITSDDFTSGTLGAWTDVTRVTIDNTIGSPSAPSARAQVAGQSAFAALMLASPVSELCMSMDVNLASGAGVDLFRLRTAANGAIIKVFVALNGTLQMRNDLNPQTRTTTTALGSGWHNVELCGGVGAATTWSLYRDGALINSWVTNTGTTAVGRIQIGDTGAKTFTANYDHVVVDEAQGDEGGAPTDTTAPSVPGTPTGTSPSAGTIQISWAPSTDTSLPITYRVYRDGNPTPVTQTTATSFTDVGLAAGSAHTYTVDAVDAAANPSAPSPASTSIIVITPPTDNTAPTVPGAPTGSSPSTSSIQLSWTGSTDASPPITYRVYRDGDAAPIGQTTTLSYTDTGLAAGSAHSYTVDAVDAATNASAKSASSASITVQTTPPPTSGDVDDFTSGNFGGWTTNTRLTIDNTIGSPAAPSARAQTTNQSAFAVRTLSSTLSQLCVSVNVNLAVGTGVDLFRLRTTTNGPIIKAFVAGNGTLQMRNDLNPATRTTTTALGTGWHNVELCGSIGAATTWSLYRDGTLINSWTTNTGATPVGRVQLGHTSAKTFTMNLDHFVVDQAQGDGGTPPADTAAPTVPGRPAGTSPSTSSIQISWAASTDATLPITYRIYRDGSAAPVGQTTSLSYTDTGLAAGSNHTYTVDAVDALTNASAKSQVSLPIVVLSAADSIPPTVPGVPTGSSPSTSSIQISWSGSTDASLPITYRIYRNGVAAPIGQTTSLSYTDTGLVAGSSHFYTVDAVDAATNASAKSAASLSITVLSGAAGLQPRPNHTRIAYDRVRTNLPRITTGEITDIEYIGNKIYVAGGFSSLRNNTATNTTTVTQANLVAIDLTTGLIDTTFRPVFGGGGVTEVEASPDGTKLFVVGRFNTVNGVTKRKIASINPTTGATISTFTANADGPATSVEASNSTVYIGGQFTTINGTTKISLAAVNATTGQLVANFNNDLGGGIGVNGELTVQAMKITHDGTKLLVVHTGRQIAGQDRYGMGLINLQNHQLLPWRSRLWDDNLQFVGGITRIYAADIAPNDQYFVVSSGSGGDRPPISDTAVAYPIDGGDNVEPLWISRLFDSVYSIAISEVAVYLGGHFNYMESPTAPDPWPGLTQVGYGRGQGLAGYGLGDDIVVRDHVGALDPLTGKAVEWNPGSNSFEGNKAMIVTPRGLITGGDATTQGGQNVARIAFYDFNSVPTVGANETTIVTPIEGRVEEADVPFSIDGTATGASGVQRVQIEVRERDTGQYLQDNLTTWGAANTINATLASPNATSTNWTLALTISGNHRIEILAKAFGVNGSSDATKALKRIETFGLSDQTPTTRVTGPGFGVIPATTFLVTGTAEDDFGVNSITLAFRDAQNRYLQNDGSTSTTYNTLRTTPDVIGATSATWSYEVTVPYESEWTVQAIAVDTEGQSDLRSADRTWLVSGTAVPPTVTIAAPAVMTPPTAANTLTLAPGSPLTFSGTAIDDEGLNYVEITLRNSATREVLTAGGTWGVDLQAGNFRISPTSNLNGTTYNWSYTTPFNLVSGTYTFTVRATDDLGLTTSNANRGSLTINVQVPGDAFPETTITPTGTQTGVQVLRLDLAGTATDDLGVSAVRVTVEETDSGRYVQANGTLAAAYSLLPATLSSGSPTSKTWTLSLDLPVQGDYAVTAFAYDTSNQQDPSSTGATSRYPIYPGDLPPTVTENLFQPADGTIFPAGRIFVSGRLEDDQQIVQGQVAVRNALGQYMTSAGSFTSTTPTYIRAFLNSPGSPGSNYSYTTPVIPAGSYTVLVRGLDQHDFLTPVPSERSVTVAISEGNLPPVANFTFGCIQNVCGFDGRTSTDEVAPTLTYSWNFGNGNGSGPVPTRTYTSAGTYTVTLTVRDENGLSAVTSQTVTIAEPSANVAPTPVINPPSCAARVCNISGVGSADSNIGDTFTYLWNFGDNTATSTASANSHTFAVDGTYTVTLIVTDGWGKSASTTRTITIARPVTNLAPTAVIGNPVCSARTCSFFGVGSSDPNGDAFTYSWNFGDASALNTTANPVKAYAADGTYTVTLTVTDAWGDVGVPASRVVTIAKPTDNAPPVPVITAPSCVGRTCSLSSAGSADPDGDTFTYSWNFGTTPTSTSTASAPSLTFPAGGPFTVTLTLTDAWGDAGTTTRTVSFTEPPGNAAPTPVIAPPACTARTCTLSATGSSDPNGDVYTYLWDFGDGSATSTSAAPTKLYAADGTYTLTLTLTDTWGKTASTTRVLTITKPAGNAAPTPVISAPSCSARACTFPGVSSFDPNGDSFTYLWNYGDGSATTTAATGTRTFTTAGPFTVTLTVTDAWGDAASTTTTITLAEPVTNVAPTPVINAPSCASRVCTFSSAGSADPNGDAFTYSWAWADGTANTTTANPSHTFPVAGTFIVTLTVTDGWGKTANTTRSVTVV